MISKIKSIFSSKWTEIPFHECLQMSIILFIFASLGSGIGFGIYQAIIHFPGPALTLIVVLSIPILASILIYTIPRIHNRKFKEMEKILYKDN